MRISFRLLLLFAFGLIAFPGFAPAEPEILIQLPFTSTLMAQASGFPREPVQPNPYQTSEANPNLPESSARYMASDLPVLMAQLKDPVGEETEIEERPDTIADPLEPVNRIFFHVNDKLYFWALKPISSGYRVVVPEDLRLGVKNFFSNLTTPVRLVNCLLQANFKGAGNETIRFLLNSTLGLAGFLDPAKTELRIEKRDEDFGQTLGFWGIGPAFYIEWPILGASSLRDTFGYAGDLLLDPKTYLIQSVPVGLAIRTYDQVNETSLRIGEYEDFKRNTLDPYIAKREAYHQNRKHKIKNR
jgi:phospholipid-binding lipoprotein MlaA